MASFEDALNKRVTIKDIAVRANVSIGTVDRVLHNRGEVKSETRDRVMAIVDELDFKPNLIAKSLALNKNFKIAILIPKAGTNNPYWKKPAEGIKMAAMELNDFNTKVTIFNYDIGNESSFINESVRLLKTEPDGVILAPHFHDAAIPLVQNCANQNIPVIYVDNDLEEKQGMAYFGQDAFQSGKVAARLMNFRLEPHSKVLILNIAPNKAVTHHMQRRERGFTYYFNSEVPDREIQIISVVIDFLDKRELSADLSRIIEENPGIRGVFVTNSRAHMLSYLFSASHKDSVMIIGYDTVEENITYLKKGLIDLLICQKPYDQGYLSVMAMFDFLFTGKQPEKVNYSPIDIIMKENIDYYHSNEAIY